MADRNNYRKKDNVQKVEKIIKFKAVITFKMMPVEYKINGGILT